MVKRTQSKDRPRIALLDQRRQVFGPPIQAVAAALQTQVTRDFAPQWGREAQILAIPAGHVPPKETWWLVILDYAGRGALGHHFVNSEGLPQAIVGAISCGERWPVVASHELLEMLCNPLLDAYVYNSKIGQNIPREVCDPCEGDAYRIDAKNSDSDAISIQVANFVYPSWFRLDGNRSGAGRNKGRNNERNKNRNQDAGPFDQMRMIRAPFDVSPNGGRIDTSGCPQAGSSASRNYAPPRNLEPI